MISRIFALILVCSLSYIVTNMLSVFWFFPVVVLVCIAAAVSTIAVSSFPILCSRIVVGFAAPIFVFGTYMLFQRLAFIYQAGGMDSPDGFGSPMAFLIGFVFEQVFFTLFSLTLICLYWKYTAKEYRHA